MRRNPGRSIFAWALRLALVLVVASGCHSCSFLDPIGAIFAGHFKRSAKAPEGGHYLGLKAKKSGAGATVRPNRELWKPFRLETTLGLFDDDHADLGADGSFGVSVLQSGGIGAFYIVQVKRSGAGIVIETGTGGAPLGTLTIPDSTSADVVIESVGGLVVFSGRRRGDANYTPIASAVAASAGPYQASLDVGGIPKGTIVGYARARLTANGARPSPTATQSTRETIWTAIDALMESMYAIDEAVPDRTSAGDQIDLAVARLDAALAMDLSELPGAAKKLKSTRKKAAALVAGTRGTKSVNSVLKGLQAVVKLAGQAADPER